MAAACLKDVSTPAGIEGARISWYAVQVRNRHEKLVASLLRGKGYCEYLPSYVARRRWSDRVAEVEVPLFPGYVFCRFDPSERRIPIVSTPGVVRIVGGVHGPLPVSEAELAAVRRIIDSGIAAQPWPFLAAGQRVRIEHGPLAGIEGALVEAKGGFRLVISISLLQRSINVDIDTALVVPVHPLVLCDTTAAYNT